MGCSAHSPHSSVWSRGNWLEMLTLHSHLGYHANSDRTHFSLRNCRPWVALTLVRRKGPSLSVGTDLKHSTIVVSYRTPTASFRSGHRITRLGKVTSKISKHRSHCWRILSTPRCIPAYLVPLFSSSASYSGEASTSRRGLRRTGESLATCF